MFLTKNTRGFTLIELLVVITIIGILATGGVVTYTSQIQKARDTTRITDVKAVQSGVEQFYQDKSEYPLATYTAGDVTTFAGVVTYVPKLPRDPKTGQSCNSGGGTAPATACDYLYNVSSDTNGIARGEYKISTAFENLGNIDSKAKADGGSTNETNRLELGLNLANIKSTECTRTAPVTPATATTLAIAALCPTGGATAANALLIAGN